MGPSCAYGEQHSRSHSQVLHTSPSWWLVGSRATTEEIRKNPEVHRLVARIQAPKRAGAVVVVVIALPG